MMSDRTLTIRLRPVLLDPRRHPIAAHLNDPTIIRVDLALELPSPEGGRTSLPFRLDTAADLSQIPSSWIADGRVAAADIGPEIPFTTSAGPGTGSGRVVRNLNVALGQSPDLTFPIDVISTRGLSDFGLLALRDLIARFDFRLVHCTLMRTASGHSFGAPGLIQLSVRN